RHWATAAGSARTGGKRTIPPRDCERQEGGVAPAVCGSLRTGVVRFSPVKGQAVRSASAPRQQVERQLVAIVAADIAGYSRLMGADEEGTLAKLKACRRELIEPGIARHNGRIVKTTGDGFLIEFSSPVEA